MTRFSEWISVRRRIMDKSKTSDNVELARMRYALWLAVFGLGLSGLLVVVLALVAGMHASADIVAIVGTFTSVTGTLVGAFFGMQIGAAGREEERTERKEAEAMTRMAFGMLTPEQTDQVVQKMGQMGG
jgi:hypothetical protein